MASSRNSSGISLHTCSQHKESRAAWVSWHLFNKYDVKEKRNNRNEAASAFLQLNHYCGVIGQHWTPVRALAVMWRSFWDVSCSVSCLQAKIRLGLCDEARPSAGIEADRLTMENLGTWQESFDCLVSTESPTISLLMTWWCLINNISALCHKSLSWSWDLNLVLWSPHAILCYESAWGNVEYSNLRVKQKPSWLLLWNWWEVTASPGAVWVWDGCRHEMRYFLL